MDRLFSSLLCSPPFLRLSHLEAHGLFAST
jgi:hypothetical protein